jgi:hypothetical protein
MLRATYRLAVLCVLVAAGSMGYWYFNNAQSPGVRIEKLEQEKKTLEELVQRLTDERRVAKMIVTDQRSTPTGIETTLLFVEQARDGSSLPPKSFTVKGDQVWVAGLSIRFQSDFILKNNDPLRGRGIFLFTKIFGQNQTPESGLPIDDPGNIPDVYRPDPKNDAKQMVQVSQFERGLWGDFWRLVDDKGYRAEKGVAVAGGKAIYFRASPDKVYRVTLDASGNPTVDSEDIEPIYREAIRRGPAPISTTPAHPK